MKLAILGSSEITLLIIIILIILIRRLIKKTKSSAEEFSRSADSLTEVINKYCKTCGNQINPNAIVCLCCGCDPKRGNKNCHDCGVEINPEQIMCINCGVPLKNQSLSSEDGKMVAIIAYLSLIGFIIALIQHGNNKTKLGAYHLRQVFGFMVSGLGIGLLLFLLTLPAFGMGGQNAANYAIFISIASFVVSISLLVCLIISLINAVNGKQKPAPIFGKLYEKWFANMFI